MGDVLTVVLPMLLVGVAFAVAARFEQRIPTRLRVYRFHAIAYPVVTVLGLAIATLMGLSISKIVVIPTIPKPYNTFPNIIDLRLTGCRNKVSRVRCSLSIVTEINTKHNAYHLELQVLRHADDDNGYESCHEMPPLQEVYDTDYRIELFFDSQCDCPLIYCVK